MVENNSILEQVCTLNNKFDYLQQGGYVFICICKNYQTDFLDILWRRQAWAKQELLEIWGGRAVSDHQDLKSTI